MEIDRTERRIVAEKLQDQGTMVAHILHEVYRCNHVHKAGLTEGEIKHLDKTHEMLNHCLDRMRTIKDRARQQL